MALVKTMDHIVQIATGATDLTAQAQLHNQRAMEIFEMVFEDEPALLEEKRKEIGQAALVSRQKNQKLLV